MHVVGKNRELLRITKLLTVFEVYDSTGEAERSFARARQTGHLLMNGPMSTPMPNFRLNSPCVA